MYNLENSSQLIYNYRLTLNKSQILFDIFTILYKEILYYLKLLTFYPKFSIQKLLNSWFLSKLYLAEYYKYTIEIICAFKFLYI